MDQSSEHGSHQAVHEDAWRGGASWGAWAGYGFTLLFVAPLYLAAAAGGEAIGMALTGEQGLVNLVPAALAMYILHRCFWD